MLSIIAISPVSVRSVSLSITKSDVPEERITLRDLPDEIIGELCNQMDIPTLRNFQNSSRRIAEICDIDYTMERIRREGGGRIDKRYLDIAISLDKIEEENDTIIGYGPIEVQWRQGKFVDIPELDITYQDLIKALALNVWVLLKRVNEYIYIREIKRKTGGYRYRITPIY